MVPYEFVYSFMMENFQHVSTKGMEFLARCALCGDSSKNARKRRFNLKYDTNNIYFHCFNCGKSGTFIQLYSHVKGISPNEAIKIIKKKSFQSIKESLTKPKPIIKKVSETNGFFDHLKKDWISITDKPEGVIQKDFQQRLVKFIKDRCLPKLYPFYIAYSGDDKGRIIIPILDKDKNIIYYQGRSLDKNSVLRYKNPEMASKKTIILNEPNFDKDKYIIITEGSLDAICVGNQGTCCFGSSIDDGFLGKLKKLTNKGIIIALDNDVEGTKAMKKIIVKSRYAKSLLYFKMPTKHKDLNEFHIEQPNVDLYIMVINNSMGYMEYIVKNKIKGQNYETK